MHVPQPSPSLPTRPFLHAELGGAQASISSTRGFRVAAVPRGVFFFFNKGDSEVCACSGGIGQLPPPPPMLLGLVELLIDTIQKPQNCFSEGIAAHSVMKKQHFQ